MNIHETTANNLTASECDNKPVTLKSAEPSYAHAVRFKSVENKENLNEIELRNIESVANMSKASEITVCTPLQDEGDDNFTTVVNHNKRERKMNKSKRDKGNVNGSQGGNKFLLNGANDKDKRDHQTRNREAKSAQAKSQETKNVSEKKVFVDAPLPKVNPWQVKRSPIQISGKDISGAPKAVTCNENTKTVCPPTSNDAKNKPRSVHLKDAAETVKETSKEVVHVQPSTSKEPVRTIQPSATKDSAQHASQKVIKPEKQNGTAIEQKQQPFSGVRPKDKWRHNQKVSSVNICEFQSYYNLILLTAYNMLNVILTIFNINALVQWTNLKLQIIPF